MAVKKEWTEMITVVPDVGPPNPEPALRKLKELLQADPPDVGEISAVLQGAEWGGDKTALLLVLLVRRHAEAKPLADECVAAERAVGERNEELQALERFHPMHSADIVPHAEAVRGARQKWTDALTRCADCQRARRRVAWVEGFLFWFFGLPRPKKSLGEWPGEYADDESEAAKLFKALKLDPQDPDSWRTPRVETQPRRRARLTTVSTITR